MISPSNHCAGSICPECAMYNRKVGRLLNTAEFIRRAIKIHGNKYDYSLVEYKNAKTKVKIICPEHGVFQQLPSSHINQKHGCPKCARLLVRDKTKYTTETFIRKAKEIHGDTYDYSKVKYINSHTKIKIICPKHGVFTQLPYHHLQGGGCPSCSHNVSKYEDNIKDILDNVGIKYIHRDREILNGIELDIYIPKHKLAIEVNGVYWHSELRGKDKNYHLNKTNLCKEKGIRLIHYTDLQIRNNFDIIKSQLNSILNINKKKLYARKCEVKKIETPLKSKFLKKYHLQGNDSSSIKLGLFYNNKLVSVMTFCKRRIALGKKSSDKNEYELSRFCNNFNFYVIGGASKLLKYFERNYNPSKIVTYADKRWSTGDLYFKLGFKHTHDSKPNYWYFKQWTVMYHRYGFRKSELNKKLEKFNPNKSEWENMKANGWNRIWDCGTMVFMKSISYENPSSPGHS